MKNLKILSLGIAMLICFNIKAQEKTVIDSISKIKESKFTKIEIQIPPAKISPNFVKTDSSPSFRIVCAKTIPNKDEPLYIVDGMEIKTEKFAQINPNNIENIKVLKGIDATSIYGIQGRNGVVIITTKNKNNQNNNDE